MDAAECIKSRTTVREYLPEDLPEEDVREILEAAVAAPSSGNSQDWEFVVVRNRETKRKLAEAALGQRFVEEAPVAIVVCCNRKRNLYGERGSSLYSIQNSAAAIENLMLAAWSKGVGSCWVGAFRESEVAAAVGLPEDVRPLAIITLGYPKRIPEKPRRLPLDSVVHRERF